jgi:hypothetical protein
MRHGMLLLLALPLLGAEIRPGARAALAVRVLDASTGRPLPARVVVRAADGRVVDSRYRALPGVFTDEEGHLEMALDPGTYGVLVSRGIDYEPEPRTVVVEAGGRAEAVVRLSPWLDLRARGWVNGDAHAHLYSDEEQNHAMLDTVRRICRGQGVDYLFACQTWAGFRDATWREGFLAHSDDRFRVFYGAEMPKYRTGHTFWFGLRSTRGLFEAAMDTTYEDEYYKAPRGTGWTFDSLAFPAIPDLEVVRRVAAAEDALAAVPHPTSWWWQKRGDVEKYVTNVAVSLSAGLLGGGAWSAMVVMGYDRDQDFYQDLWFHALDEGYRLAAVGELDGGFSPEDRFYYGRVRTYARAGGTLDRGSLVAAVRAGHTFVTSGPVVLASIDGRFEPGDVVPADGRPRRLSFEAFASGEREDRLAYVVVFRNGSVHRLFDLRGRGLRRFEGVLAVSEKSDGWYVLKAHSGKASRAPLDLDVRANVERAASGRPGPARDDDGDVCLTSPFYFRRKGVPAEPAALRSRLRLRLVDAASGQPVRGATVGVQVGGRVVDVLAAPEGEARGEAPAAAVLVLEAPGRPTLRRVAYLDYPPARARVERLANGRWLDDFGGRDRLKPGQVPWSAFAFAETKALLSDVDWTIRWEPNERDPRWDAFESAFTRTGAGARPGP